MILLLSSISTYFSYLLLRLHPSFRTSSLQRWSVGTRSLKRWSAEAPLPKSSGFCFESIDHLEETILKDVKCIVLLSSLTSTSKKRILICVKLNLSCLKSNAYFLPCPCQGSSSYIPYFINESPFPCFSVSISQSHLCLLLPYYSDSV